MTVFPIENFELKLEWAVEPGGNSGIMWRVNPNIGGAPYETGPEMQILDDIRHADGGNPYTSAGSDYACMPVRTIGLSIRPTSSTGSHHRQRRTCDRPSSTTLRSSSTNSGPTIGTKALQSKFTAWPGYGMRRRKVTSFSRTMATRLVPQHQDPAAS